MNIAYITLWSPSSGLFRSTVKPSLDIVSSMPEVNSVTVFAPSEEKEECGNFPLPSKANYTIIKNCRYLFITGLALLAKLLICHNRMQFRLIICRGSQSGALGLVVKLLFRIPFVVESFEPHSAYMLDSGCWSKYGIKYRTQNLLERYQISQAMQLMVVSRNYYQKLLGDKLAADKVSFAPCPTDTSVFYFDKSLRTKLRNKLRISQSTIVGIYIGKFEGIYFGEEGFRIFEQAANHFKNFVMIIISEQPSDEIIRIATNIKIDFRLLNHLKHNEINGYLCAADFAFTNVKPGHSKKYCCPIKNGEYLANELPILISENIGDDSEEIRKNNMGSVYNGNYPHDENWEQIESIIKSMNRETSKMRKWVEAWRTIEFTRSSYVKLFKNLIPEGCIKQKTYV